MCYVHVYSDKHGKSHFSERDLPMEERDVAPPADPALASDELPVSGLRVMRLPPGWYGEWHPSPYRLWMLVLSGASICEVSSGERRTIRAGEIYLLEDTEGRGHLSMNAGDEDLVIAIARVEDHPVQPGGVDR